MFPATASITSSLPIITTTTPLPPAATMQGASATTSPTAITNDPASQRYKADANGHRPLQHTDSVADLPSNVKAADSDRS